MNIPELLDKLKTFEFVESRIGSQVGTYVYYQHTYDLKFQFGRMPSHYNIKYTAADTVVILEHNLEIIYETVLTFGSFYFETKEEVVCKKVYDQIISIIRKAKIANILKDQENDIR